MQFRRLVLVMVSSLLTVGQHQAWAQATTSLNGHVTDSKGAIIPAATATLTLTATGAVRVDTSDRNGEYHFPQIQPGRYELDVSFKGFAMSKNTGIDILVNQPATYNVVLAIATTTTEVTVNTNIQPLLNTTDATLGNALDAEQVEDLPTAGRNTNLLLTLQPGVVYLGPSKVSANGNDTRSGAVNGGRSDQGNLTLDGVGVNDINSGGDFSPILRITQDTVAEFRVTTSDPTAEQGHSSGAQTAMVTKSGSNNFHGTVYEYNKTNLWQANDFFIKQTEQENGTRNIPGKLIYNVFGATVGGPIMRDRAFLFGNYEGLRQTVGGNGSAIVPTASFRAGNVTYVCAKASQCTGTSPSLLAGLTLNTLTPAQVKSMDSTQNIGESPIVLSLLQSLPMPNDFNEGDLLNYAGYDFTYSTSTNNNDFTARFDWNITSNGKHSAFWRGTQQADTGDAAPTYPGQPPSQRARSHNKGFAAGYTYVHSSDLVNNLTLGLTRQGTSTSGQLSSPYITFYFTTPYATTPTTSAVVPVYNLVDNLSWTLQSHNLAFGTNMRFIEDMESSNLTSYANASGVQQYFSGGVAGSNNAFDPSAPGSGFPAVAAKSYNGRVPYNNAITAIAGLLSTGTVNYNTTKTGLPLPQGAPLVYDYRWNEYEFYAQDTWKATKDLTLTYGLRYSYQQVPAETSGAQVGVCQIANSACASGPFSLTAFLNNSAALATAGQKVNNAGELGFPLNGRYNNQPDYWTPDKLDFAPRLSIAYFPTGGSGLLSKIFGNGKTGIRAGFSMAYDHFGAGIVNTFASTGSYGLATTLSTNSGTFTSSTAPRITGINSVPSALLPPAPTVGFPGIPANAGAASAQIYWSEDSAIKTPYSEMVDFSIARQIRNGSSIEISYVGRFAHRLLEQEDVSMPTNLTTGGMDYFTAARQLAIMGRAGIPVASVQPNSYWETLFAGLAGKNIGYGSGLTATQNVYGIFLANQFNETTALYNLDLPNSVTSAGVNTSQSYPSYRFYHDQFSALYAWRSVGNSNYNALQAVYRQRFDFGLHADVNYAYSKSLDITSQAERETDSGLNNGSQIINTWSPNQLYGPSDFDIRHQITSDFIWDLPVGRNKQFLSSIGRWTNEWIGGWQVTGIVRWTSGLPFEVVNGKSNYPTNWDIEGYETLSGAAPKAKDGSNPASGRLTQVFANPTAAQGAFSHALPGDSGTRNPLRGDGYFEVDTGLGKTFPVTDGMKLKLGVELFNVSNSVRFDPRTIGNDPSDNSAAFGYATQTLTQSRLAQFYGRLQF